MDSLNGSRWRVHVLLAGAALYVRLYPRLRPLLEKGDRGKVTLPQATRTSPWPWVAGMAAALLGGVLVGRLR